MTWLNSAVSAAANAGGSSGWLSAAADYAVDAFDWLDSNPSAANVLGGVAAGIGQYYTQKEVAEDDRDFQMEMYKRKYQDSRINPGEIGDYGSHMNTLSNGLISNGMIAGG